MVEPTEDVPTATRRWVVTICRPLVQRWLVWTTGADELTIRAMCMDPLEYQVRVAGMPPATTDTDRLMRRFEIPEGWTAQEKHRLVPIPVRVKRGHEQLELRSGPVRVRSHAGACESGVQPTSRGAQLRHRREQFDPGAGMVVGQHYSKTWNQPKEHRGALVGGCKSKEAYKSGLDGLARALANWSSSAQVASPSDCRFPAGSRASVMPPNLCGSGPGPFGLGNDRHHVVLPRLGRIRTQESRPASCRAAWQQARRGSIGHSVYATRGPLVLCISGNRGQQGSFGPRGPVTCTRQEPSIRWAAHAAANRPVTLPRRAYPERRDPPRHTPR